MEEDQFRHAQLSECPFFMSTPRGYRWKKWYAVIGDTVILIPCSIWIGDSMAIYSPSIGTYLTGHINNVSYFLKHEIELSDGDIVEDRLTHMHITLDLTTTVQELLGGLDYAD